MGRAVKIAILADARQAKGELKSFEKAAGRIGPALKAGIAVAATAVGVGMFKAVTAASNLGETLNKSNVIFGKSAKEMRAWAKTSAKAAGLSENAALSAASGFGDMFQQIGFNQKASKNLSKSTVQLAADLGSFNNLDTADVLDRISAAYRGEFDSLQAVIPNINAARVETEALAITHKKSAKELTAQDKALAVNAILLKDGKRAIGDFAKTADGAANKQKILRAQFDNLSANLGKLLLPAFSKVLDVGQKFVDWLDLKAIPAASAFAKTIETKLVPGVKAAFRLVSKNLPQIDLSGAFKASTSAAKNYVQPIINAFTVGTRTGDYTALGAALATKIGDALGGLGALAGRLKESLSKVDWLTVGEDVGRTAIPFAIGFINTLFEPLFTGEFWSKHWKAVFGAAISFIPLGKGASLAGRIAGKLGLSKGITGAVIKGLEGSVGALGLGILNTVKFIGRNFAKGFGAAFPEVTAAVGGFVKKAVAGLRGWIGGARAAGSNGAATFVRMVGLGIGSAVKSFFSAGAKASRNIGSGVVSGAKAFPGLLKNAGQQVISGFLSGLQEKWKSVESWFGWATSRIPIKKGPPAKDATLLVKSGRLVMGGFLSGLQSNYGKIEGSLKTFTSKLAKAAALKLTALADQRKAVVANLVQAKNELSAAVRDNLRGPGITGLVDFSTVASGARGDSLVKALQARLKAIREYGVGVRALATKGIGRTITRQLLEAGLDGAPVVAALRNASPAIIKQLALLDSQIARESAAYGSQLSGLVFDRSIATAQKTAAQPVQLVFKGDGSTYSKLLLAELRKAIKAGGGNAQVVLGTGR